MSKIKDIAKTIAVQTKAFLLSPRLVAFYWHAGGMIVVQFLNIVSEQLVEMSAPSWLVITVGLVLAQITKAINNKQSGKRIGILDK